MRILRFCAFCESFPHSNIFFCLILSTGKKATRINEFHFNLIFLYLKEVPLHLRTLSIILTCSVFNAIAFTLANELNNKEDGNGTAIVNFLFKFKHTKKICRWKKFFFDDVMRAMNIVRKCLDTRWKHSRAKVIFGQYCVRIDWRIFWCSMWKHRKIFHVEKKIYIQNNQSEHWKNCQI